VERCAGWPDDRGSCQSYEPACRIQRGRSRALRHLQVNPDQTGRGNCWRLEDARLDDRDPTLRFLEWRAFPFLPVIDSRRNHVPDDLAQPLAGPFIQVHDDPRPYTACPQMHIRCFPGHSVTQLILILSATQIFNFDSAMNREPGREQATCRLAAQMDRDSGSPVPTRPDSPASGCDSVTLQTAGE
jgi:hypothetical protein